MNKLNVNIFVLLMLLICSSALANLNSDSTTVSTTTVMTPSGHQHHMHDDQIASSSDNVDDTSSMNNFQTKMESPSTRSQQQSQSNSQSRSQPTTSALISSSEGDSLQPKMLMFQSVPGQFIPFLNREVGPGHITMIGYTTPIVKIGDPIPLEQYLKEQRQFQQQQQQIVPGYHHHQRPSLLPISPISQEFAKIFTRITQPEQTSVSNEASSPSTEETGSVATESTDIPLRLFFPQSNSQQQTQIIDARGTLVQLQPMVPSPAPTLQAEKPKTEEKLNNQQNNQIAFDDGTSFNTQGNVADFLTLSGQGTSHLDLQRVAQKQQMALQLQQPQEPQQFVQPLDKPRPFLVVKPGFRNNPKLLHQIQIQHQQFVAQPQQAPLSQTLPSIAAQQQQQMIQQTIKSQSPDGDFRLIQPSHGHLLSPPPSSTTSAERENEIESNPFVRFQQLISTTTNAAGPQLLESQRQHLAGTSTESARPIFQHFSVQLPSNQPSFKPTTIMSFNQNAAQAMSSQNQIGQAQSSFMRSAEVLLPKLSDAAESGNNSSSVDTRAELQNQIKHVLATSPNLSEDSRFRHRDAIMKAVQSLVDTTGSTQHHTSTTDESTERSKSSDILSRFPQFHPKSMLFRFPPSTRSTVAPSMTTPLQGSSSISPSSLLNNRKPIPPSIQAFLPPIRPSNQLPLNFLSRFPSLLPGFQQTAGGPHIMASPAEPSTTSNKNQQFLQQQPQLISTAMTPQQQQSEQKLQNQIKHFLQQHDPQRLQQAQLAPQQHQTSEQGSFSSNLISPSSVSHQPHQSQPAFVDASRIVIDDNHSIRFQNPNQQPSAERIFLPSQKIHLAPGLLLSSDEPVPSSQQASINQNIKPTGHVQLNLHNQAQQQTSAQTQTLPSQHQHPLSSFTSFQPEASMVTPKTTMRGYSEWWKERALVDFPRLTMLTQLPA